MYDYIKIPEITDSIKFENLIYDLYYMRLKRLQKVGRSGTIQYGVDIYGYDDNKQLIGIQCKVKSKVKDNKSFRTVLMKELRKEVKAASEFSPDLESYYYITTSSRDAQIQQEVIQLDLSDD